jgi:hypothetical protein
MVVLKLVFPTPIVTFNMVNLVPFFFEALLLGRHRNYNTHDSLFDTLNYYHSVCYNLNFDPFAF